MRNKKIHALLLVALLVSLLAGCGTQETTLPEDAKDKVLAFSEAKTDNLLAGMKTSNYALFSGDFDQDMLKAMSQTQFETLKKDRDAKLGPYLSRRVNRVVQSGDFYTVIYDAQFEKEGAVTLRVVFRIAEPHQISGLWFNK
jgi:hypothetical protein